MGIHPTWPNSTSLLKNTIIGLYETLYLELWGLGARWQIEGTVKKNIIQDKNSIGYESLFERTQIMTGRNMRQGREINGAKQRKAKKLEIECFRSQL